MADIIIREVEDSEIDICVSVIRRSFGTVAKEFGLTKDNCPTNGAFIERERLVHEKQKGNLMFVLCDNNTVVGFVALENKYNGNFELEKLSVLPQYRHHGYGELLIDFAKDKVNALNGTKITIGIIEENIKLKNWYTKNGFKHTGTKLFPHLPFTVGFMEFETGLIF